MAPSRNLLKFVSIDAIIIIPHRHWFLCNHQMNSKTLAKKQNKKQLDMHRRNEQANSKRYHVELSFEGSTCRLRGKDGSITLLGYRQQKAP